MTGHIAIEEIYRGADSEPPDETYEDVAWEVNAQIEACPAVNKRPDDNVERKAPATHQPTEKDGDAECVTSVGGEKAIFTASIAIDYIDKGANDWIVSRTPSGYGGFYDEIVNSSCKEYAKTRTPHNESYTLQRVIVLQNKIE